MRQLVTVVRDGHLLLFTHDGDDVQQVAQLVDPGLDVRDVVGLGVTLGALYEPKPTSSPKPARTLPAASGDEGGTTASSKPKRAQPIASGIDTAELLAWIGAHPLSTSAQIAAGLGLTQHARKALDMRLWKLRTEGKVLGELRTAHDAAGHSSKLRHYSTPTPNEPEVTHYEA